MAKQVRFRTSLIRTVYSKTIERFVRIRFVDETSASEFLENLDLANLTKESYSEQIVAAYFLDLDVYDGLSEDISRKLTWELFDLILDENRYLEPSNLEQIEFPKPQRKY